HSRMYMSRKVEKSGSFFGMVGEEEIVHDNLGSRFYSQSFIFQRRNDVMIPLYKNDFSRDLFQPGGEDQPFLVQSAVKEIPEEYDFLRCEKCDYSVHFLEVTLHRLLWDRAAEFPE